MPALVNFEEGVAMDDTLHDLGQLRSISSVTFLVLLLAWESLAPFGSYFVGKTRERLLHGAKNLALGILNALLIGLVFVAVWWTTAEWAQAHQFGLLNRLRMPTWARLAGAFLLFDAWMYFWHRLNHRIPFLWRFHRTHHSDPRMDVTTASRFHLGEIFFSSVLRVPVIALLGLHLWELALYEAAMFTGVQSHHANIALAPWLDRGLRTLIVTPFMHKVHHSRWQTETDSNYSSLFSFWDRLFGSFRLRDDPLTLEFGLEEFDPPEHQTLIGLMTTPMKRVPRTDRPPVRSPSDGQSACDNTSDEGCRGSRQDRKL
jgi:sterol desaturase/sphingolipid hydroxylase (fatty acid hydroxylase superfamily)